MCNYFENKIEYDGILFQITNKPTLDEREIHTYHEILYYISGDAEILTENSRVSLKNGSLLIIPKETYHFIRLNNLNFFRLKISIPKYVENFIPIADIMKDFKLVECMPEGVLFVLSRLVQVMQNKDSKNKAFYIYALFLTLIEEIDVATTKNHNDSFKRLGVGSKIVEYISKNLDGDLSVTTIAREVGVSTSGVVHGFKKELGISLHNYITQRRLIYARGLILNGHKPSKIYADCGYSEYSSFYRAYVKFFGKAPSKENRERL